MVNKKEEWELKKFIYINVQTLYINHDSASFLPKSSI